MKLYKKVVAISLVALTLALVNCKDKTDDTTEPAKTLNKSLITNKYWKTTTGLPLDHYFKNDGTYCYPDGQTSQGTWKWLNNSDTMEINTLVPSRKVKWIAEYCTETELKMIVSGGSDWYIFTKQ
jgi:hypothetical protein